MSSRRALAVEGPAPDQEAFFIVARSTPIPVLRAPAPGAPKWVDDPDFDLGRVSVAHALPRPGNEDQLFGADRRSDGALWDRGRPLWKSGSSKARGQQVGDPDQQTAAHCMADTECGDSPKLAGLSDESMSDSFASNIHTTMQSQSASLCGGGIRNPGEALDRRPP